jgi:hypothetical protein
LSNTTTKLKYPVDTCAKEQNASLGGRLCGHHACAGLCCGLLYSIAKATAEIGGARRALASRRTHLKKKTSGCHFFCSSCLTATKKVRVDAMNPLHDKLVDEWTTANNTTIISTTTHISL